MVDFNDTSTFGASDWMSARELRAVSGFKQPSRIRQWLSDNRIPHVTPGKGPAYPRVLRKAFLRLTTAQPVASADTKADFSWMKPRKVR